MINDEIKELKNAMGDLYDKVENKVHQRGVKKLPNGTYEAQLKGIKYFDKPFVIADFDVVGYKQVKVYLSLCNGYSIHLCNEFIRYMGYPIDFNTHEQYQRSIKKANDALMNKKFMLTKWQNRGYDNYRAIPKEEEQE